MIEHTQQNRLPTWKPIMFAVVLIGLAKLLHPWLSESTAWAISAFVSSMVFYETQPRVGSPPDLRKSILMSAACALLMLLLGWILQFLGRLFT